MRNPIRSAALAVALFVMPAAAEADEPLALFADALEACTPTEGTFQVPGGTAYTFSHTIAGANADGACDYVQRGLDGVEMACAFSPEGRRAFAETLREVERGQVSFAQHTAWVDECAYVLGNGERFPVAGPMPAAEFTPTETRQSLEVAADAVASCTPAVEETLSPALPGLAIVHTITGEQDGVCQYVQTKPYGTITECALSPAGRLAFADSLREAARNPGSEETPAGFDIWASECVLILTDGTRLSLG